jgi:hypothetical protein
MQTTTSRTLLSRAVLAVLPLAALAAFAAPQRARAGTVIVSGDIEFARATNAAGNAEGTGFVDAGNQKFFTNVLGSGTKVIVETSVAGSSNDVDPALVAFYQGLGANVTEVDAGDLTASDLTGGRLFLDAVPNDPFGTSEISALQGFSQGGGTIFLLGDNANFATEDANVNTDLTALGSGLQLVPETLDADYHTGNSSQIVSNPLTAGISSFTYGGVSAVSGGTPLFLTSGG